MKCQSLYYRSSSCHKLSPLPCFGYNQRAGSHPLEAVPATPLLASLTNKNQSIPNAIQAAVVVEITFGNTTLCARASPKVALYAGLACRRVD